MVNIPLKYVTNVTIYVLRRLWSEGQIENANYVFPNVQFGFQSYQTQQNILHIDLSLGEHEGCFV